MERREEGLERLRGGDVGKGKERKEDRVFDSADASWTLKMFI